MSAEGIFHDAHEVYERLNDGTRNWLATFATRALAENYVAFQQTGALLEGLPATFEMEPV